MKGIDSAVDLFQTINKCKLTPKLNRLKNTRKTTQIGKSLTYLSNSFTNSFIYLVNINTFSRNKQKNQVLKYNHV